MNAMGWAMTSSPTTSLVCRKAASTAQPGGTWENTRIHATKESIELEDKVITPDVILHPHNASLQLTGVYTGKEFPAEYRGDIFAAEHGSWNRSVRVGYELIRVPLDESGHATGAYEDFLDQLKWSTAGMFGEGRSG